MYSEAAGLYDRLTEDVDYTSYAGYFREIFDRWSVIKTNNVMETGCGTGSLTLALAELGFEMTGIDSSAEMLSEAYVKKGPGILWVNQDVTELDLFGTYEAAVSFLDCINHILDEGSVKEYFRLMHNYIEPEGLFVFDMNSPHKFRETYGNNVFYSVGDDFAYIWQNDYDEQTCLCTMDMTFFHKEGNAYQRFDTVNIEKSYGVDYLSGLLEKAGFRIEALYNDRTFDKPSDDSERIFFVCRRI